MVRLGVTRSRGATDHVHFDAAPVLGVVNLGEPGCCHWRQLNRPVTANDRQTNPEARQPSKEELEEVIKIDATPDQLAAAVLTGGATRREPSER